MLSATVLDDFIHSVEIKNETMRKLKTSKRTSTGGINLSPANKVLQIQNGGMGIKFHITAAQLAQLQNAPGFVPVIISIQPMLNLREFLGLNQLEQANASG